MSLDRILVELKIISKLNEGDKIRRTNNGNYSVDTRYFRGLRRSYTGDNRQTGLNDIENTILKGDEKINDLMGLESLKLYKNNNKPTEVEIDKHMETVIDLRMIKQAYMDALIGIINLIKTYESDSHIVGRLSLIKLKMEQKIIKMKEILEEYHENYNKKTKND